MKRLLALITGIILLTAVGTHAFAAATGDIAAVVNDSVITTTDVNDRTNLYLTGAPQAPSEAERAKMQQQVLTKLIDESLEMQEAKKLDITVEEAQVNNGFAFVAKQNNLSPEDFKKRLKNSGVNIDSLYAQIKAEMAWDQVIRRKLRPQISVSDSDIDMTMDQLAHGEGKKQYHVAEIVIPVPNPAEESDARAKAEDAIQKIRGGDTFSSTARAISSAPGASNGGDIGWVEEGQLDPAIEKALTALQPGQISDPIRTSNGFHIVFLREVRRTAADPLADNTPAPVAAPVPSQPQSAIVTLKQIIIPVKPTDPVTVIRAKQARGFALKKEITSCDALDKRMKEFPSKGTGTLGTGPEDALHPVLKKIIAKLQVNELSDPIQAPGGWALIMVCSRQMPAAATPPPAAATTSVVPDKLNLDKTDEKARESVADKIGAVRLNKMADHYLTDLREAAFIDRRI
jgi:peptidyl-prolyl cis-trans isomerase SurA